jgi:hypothetical protein
MDKFEDLDLNSINNHNSNSILNNENNETKNSLNELEGNIYTNKEKGKKI